MEKQTLKRNMVSVMVRHVHMVMCMVVRFKLDEYLKAIGD